MPRNSAHPLLRWSCLSALLAASVLPAIAQTPKPGMPRSERHESRHEIDQLEDNWRSVTLKRDASALANLLSEDYIGITANGTLQSKDETLANIRSGITQFTRLDLSDRKVRFYGQTAVVTSRAEVSGTGPNGEIAGSYRYTRVYVRDAGGKWRIVSFEASRIREPGDKK